MKSSQSRVITRRGWLKAIDVLAGMDPRGLWEIPRNFMRAPMVIQSNIVSLMPCVICRKQQTSFMAVLKVNKQ